MNLIAAFPGRELTKMPTRQDWNIGLFHEHISRLEVLGVVEKSSPHGGIAFKFTERGSLVYKLCGLMADLQLPIDIHAALFLSSIRYPRRGRSLDKNCQRLIIRLACIMVVQPHAFCLLKKLYREATPAEVAAAVEGVGAKKASNGAAWIALGNWQKFQKTNSFASSSDGPAQVSNGLFSISRQWGSRILNATNLLEGFFGLSSVLDELEETRASDEQLEDIEVEMMWAWLHGTAYFDCSNSASTVDILSGKMLFSFEQELLDIEKKRQIHTGGGFLAIYSDLELVTVNEQKGLHAQSMTVIPMKLYSEVTEAFGIKYPIMVHSTYVGLES
ncbi:putative Helicase ATP-binding domain-containing protein [Seiridium cardinale]